MSSLPGWRRLPIGVVNPVPGSSISYKTSDWRTLRPVIDSEKCIRCRTCWLYCPEGTIIEVDEPYKTKAGREYKISYKVDYDHCKGCGICANECPVKAITMVEEVV